MNYRVIFVHGLGANPNTTWKCGQTCWITDLLPEDLRVPLHSGVGLYKFNYKSFWLRRSNERLREQAKELIQVLTRDEV